MDQLSCWHIHNRMLVNRVDSACLVQIVNLELTPAEFEERVLGVRQDWRQSLLVEIGEQDQAGLQQALPLGQWLQQHSMAVDEQGRLLQPQASRFAREAGAASHQPCLSGPDR